NTRRGGVMKKAVLAAALAFATFAGVHAPAASQELVATFSTKIGDAPVPGATASLKLNPDGTILATLVSLSNWQLTGFGVDSSAVYESHDFSAPTGVFSTVLSTSFGDFWTGWGGGETQNNLSMTWLIGTPGTFTSLSQIINGSHSPYDAFAYVLNLSPFGTTEYAANFTLVAAVPEPETQALLMAGLGALAIVARRRKKTLARRE